jgi:hypothetical protein
MRWFDRVLWYCFVESPGGWTQSARVWAARFAVFVFAASVGIALAGLFAVVGLLV